MSSWAEVIEGHYDVADATLIRQYRHKNTHYHLRSDSAGELLLSSYETAPGGPDFAFHQRALLALKKAGLATVQQPVRSRTGSPTAFAGGKFWYLRDYIRSEDNADWMSLDLVRDAARALAAVHEMSQRLEIHDPFSPEQLSPFHWTVLDLSRRVEGLLDRFLAATDLSGRRCDEIQEGVAHFLELTPSCSSRVADLPLRTLTHQDYRPANLCVSANRVAYIWDWDLAREDVCLYDVAFASLQFGGREVVFPGFSVEHVEAFVREYFRERSLDHAALRDVMSWCYLAVVLKRLLQGWHVKSRLDLLAELYSSGLVTPR